MGCTLKNKDTDLFFEEMEKKLNTLIEKKVEDKFNNYMKIIKRPAIMAQILGIMETEDITILFKEFQIQYCLLIRESLYAENDLAHEQFMKNTMAALKR